MVRRGLSGGGGWQAMWISGCVPGKHGTCKGPEADFRELQGSQCPRSEEEKRGWGCPRGWREGPLGLW